VVGARHQARSTRVADVEAVLLVLLRPDRLAREQEAEADEPGVVDWWWLTSMPSTVIASPV
jgi:hypothetical protein